MKRNTVYGHVTLNNGTSVVAVNSGNITFTNARYGISRTAPIINGVYSMNNVIPYGYNVTVRSNGKTYTNFTNIQVTGNAQQFQNLAIKMDRINVSASINGLGLPVEVCLRYTSLLCLL